MHTRRHGGGAAYMHKRCSGAEAAARRLRGHGAAVARPRRGSGGEDYGGGGVDL